MLRGDHLVGLTRLTERHLQRDLPTCFSTDAERWCMWLFGCLSVTEPVTLSVMDDVARGSPERAKSLAVLLLIDMIAGISKSTKSAQMLRTVRP